ncbi:MAG: toxin-activating lysine-acyltransferase [Hyphomicrobiaceae bacterium]|nr:toxin-activating lysine-acyltransferase [Hyphomicrobiaceae bacterium]
MHRSRFSEAQIIAIQGEREAGGSAADVYGQHGNSDLEWFVMTPVLLQQFRLYYDQQKPIGVVLWARVDAETEARLEGGATKLRPQDWRSGDRLWIVEVIAPFGGAEEMIRDLKSKVYPDKELRFVTLGRDGKKELRVV